MSSVVFQAFRPASLETIGLKASFEGKNSGWVNPGITIRLKIGGTVPVASGGKADQVDGGDVGAEQGDADDGPGHRTTAEEKLAAGRVLAVSRKDSEGDDSHEVGDDNDKVEGRDVHGFGGRAAWVIPPGGICCGTDAGGAMSKVAGS